MGFGLHVRMNHCFSCRNPTDDEFCDGSWLVFEVSVISNYEHAATRADSMPIKATDWTREKNGPRWMLAWGQIASRYVRTRINLQDGENSRVGKTDSIPNKICRGEKCGPDEAQRRN